VALPLKEVSEQSAREKSIRHGHISTLHIWWARRPLAACRAVVFASLIPDPDDPECPATFRQLVKDTLAANEFRPKNGNGSTVEDTPRNRCQEFIKHLVRWENSNKPEYIEPARKLIAAAHKFLHPHAEGDAPKVLDPFAGGGAIPLEALRLGCEAHAIDLNPVAHLLELGTLVYPQKYGQPDSRPVPGYIKRLIAHNKAKRRVKGGSNLFDGEAEDAEAGHDELIPDVEITEAEYRKNPMAGDVKYWGHWILAQVRDEIGQFYPADADGGIPVAYLWARTVTCPNPACGATIPLVRQLWLCKKARRKVALRLVPDAKAKRCRFEVVEGKQIDFDPEHGTMKQGKAACPFCSVIVDGKTMRTESKAKRMGQQMIAVVATLGGRSEKSYRVVSEIDRRAFEEASKTSSSIPSDYLTEKLSKQQPRLLWVQLYGLDNWRSLYNERQLLFLWCVHGIIKLLSSHEGFMQLEAEYQQAVVAFLGIVLDRIADRNVSLCTWVPPRELIGHVFGRQGLAMVWDYVENVPLAEASGNWPDAIEWVTKCIDSNSAIKSFGIVQRGSATCLPYTDSSLESVMTDPPYYDAVPYADLSDFFYVLLKQSAGRWFPDLFRTPLTPKAAELIEERPHASLKQRKDKQFYEDGMAAAFKEMSRAMDKDTLTWIMFAHKTTAAWETLVGSLQKSALVVSASWPLHTERMSRMIAQGTASLASTIVLICRKREQTAGDGLWDDVRQELQKVARERLDFFWSQHIRGADFFISAIGPALSVFGRYARVARLSGEEVTVGQFLDEVRALVTNYALDKILHTKHTASIDSESRFAVVWKWSYLAAKVPADEAFKLAQGLGFDTESMWGRSGVLVKSGENVQAMPVEKRMKIKGLGEPAADTTAASLIDVLHRLCAFREKGDLPGMVQFLGSSGQEKNPNLWVVAQAISEILPEGDKEKQLMQGLLNQREQVEEMAQKKELF
jgi:adenine-specific DNA methylase